MPPAGSLASKVLLVLLLLLPDPVLPLVPVAFAVVLPDCDPVAVPVADPSVLSAVELSVVAVLPCVAEYDRSIFDVVDDESSCLGSNGAISRFTASNGCHRDADAAVQRQTEEIKLVGRMASMGTCIASEHLKRTLCASMLLPLLRVSLG